MKLKNLPIAALLGLLLTVATAATAGDAKMTAKDANVQSDWTTALQVKLALLEKLGTDSLHIDAVSAGGEVTLNGTVAKRETMELASTVAKTVAGVDDVENNVKLQASVDNSSRPAAVVGETDSEVKDALLETKLRLALIRSLGEDGFQIGTDAASGVVTLAFNHDLASARRALAVSVAEDISGVSKVISIDKVHVDKT